MIERVLTEKGYYEPLLIKYLKWVRAMFRFDFGYSIQFKTPVIELIGERLPHTLLLTVPTLILSFFLSLMVSFITGWEKTQSQNIKNASIYFENKLMRFDIL